MHRQHTPTRRPQRTCLELRVARPSSTAARPHTQNNADSHQHRVYFVRWIEIRMPIGKHLLHTSRQNKGRFKQVFAIWTYRQAWPSDQKSGDDIIVPTNAHCVLKPIQRHSPYIPRAEDREDPARLQEQQGRQRLLRGPLPMTMGRFRVG